MSEFSCFAFKLVVMCSYVDVYNYRYHHTYNTKHRNTLNGTPHVNDSKCDSHATTQESKSKTLKKTIILA